VGTYDIAFKRTNSQTDNLGQSLLSEALEFLHATQLEEARSRFIQAIEAFNLVLNNRKHDRVSREGIIESWTHLAKIYPAVESDIYPKECIDDIHAEGLNFGMSNFKTSIIDNLLESDWKKQCLGKYGGRKPSNKTWKRFYFDNEKEFESYEKTKSKIIWAVKNGHDSLLSFLLDKDKDFKISDTVSTSSKESFLEIAVKNGFSSTVDILLYAGAKASAPGTGKWTPLHWAVQKGYKTITLTLLEKDAKINVKDDNGLTPLHLAAYHGHDEIVDLLLEKGARVNVLTLKNKYSPLHLAVFKDNKDIAENLIEKGCSVKDKDAHKRTLLHWTAAFGKTKMSELLISCGVNINAQDDLGRTPLHWAAQCRHNDVMDILLHYKAKPNELDNFDNRAMLISAFINDTKGVSMLFSYGAR
jgi:ankyrin repeat protein